VTVLLTGASGFVGRALSKRLSADGVAIRSAVRTARGLSGDVALIPAVGPGTDWSDAVSGVRVVVHLAARVHVMRDTARDPLREFREVNTEGTARLAEQAAEAGVRRFVYLSTIKVNGEYTEEKPFDEHGSAHPGDAYAVSKWEAEQRLQEIGSRTGLEIVIVRPPLVYGPGVKGNLLKMLRWIDGGWPLPFANVANRRSLVSLSNLGDFVVRCIDDPRAAGETFLIADGEDVTTAELVCGLAAGMRRRPRLVPVPRSLLHHALRLSGREGLWQRLYGSLQIDSSKARILLDWQPPQRVDRALEDVGAWYVDHARAGVA